MTNISKKNIKLAEEAWKSLTDACIDDNECIDTDWDVANLGHYECGTSRYEIWHDIEDTFGVAVAYLMGEAPNPDGSGRWVCNESMLTKDELGMSFGDLDAMLGSDFRSRYDLNHACLDGEKVYCLIDDGNWLTICKTSDEPDLWTGEWFHCDVSFTDYDSRETPQEVFDALIGQAREFMADAVSLN